MTPERDARWHRIFENVPSHLLVALAKKCPGHSLEKLSQDQEARVDEVFRVCDSQTIDTLLEEFPGPSNLVAWFYEAERSIAQGEVNKALDRVVGNELLNGIKPKIEEKPNIYKVERSRSGTLLRWVAGDREQNLPVSFGETESITVLSYYDAVLHFSEVEAIVFGPYSGRKADSVLSEVDSFLGINGGWKLLKPEAKRSREFYDALKKKTVGLLVETKRHDPVLLQSEMEKKFFPLVKIPPLRGGDFQGRMIHRPMPVSHGFASAR